MRVLRIMADIHVSNIEEAKSFYTDFLGLSTEEFNMGGSRDTPPLTPARPTPGPGSSSSRATPPHQSTRSYPSTRPT